MNIKNKTTILALSTLFIGSAHAAGGFGETLLKEFAKGILKPVNQQQSTVTGSTQTNSSQSASSNSGGLNTELYTGSPRWGIGTGIIYDGSADASMSLALKLQANPKASSKVSAKDYFTTWELNNSSNREFWFKTAQGMEVRPNLLQCHYKESLDPNYVKPYAMREVKVNFWNIGTRVALHNSMTMHFDEYSEKIIDTEIDVCPKTLAQAFEAAHGPNVWASLEPRFQKNLPENIKSSKDYLIQMRKNTTTQSTTGKDW